MQRNFFMACAALVVSAAAVVGVKAYNRSQMSDFALANIEALSQNEAQLGTLRGTCHKISGLCFYVCDSCNQRGEIDKKGPIKTVHGTCECGQVIN